jgi:signal transduction histidine kinase
LAHEGGVIEKDETDQMRLARLELEAQRERALQRVTAGLSSAATQQEILRSFLDEGSRVLSASAAAAYVIERAAPAARLVAHVGISESFARSAATLPFDAGTPIARSMRERRPVWVTSSEELDGAFPALEPEGRHPFERRALAALPLIVGGEVVGGIGFAFLEEHSFDQGERDFLSALAIRVQAAMERARLLEESQQLLRFNEIVSGILAHDLRNPLAAVLMNAHILRTAESERSRAIGRRIVTSGERMSRMIDQILEWTRLRGGRGGIQLARAACDLRVVVEEAVGEIRARVGDVPIAIDARGDTRGSWDADRLAQVVSNLVGNAIEHASRPGVSIILGGEGSQVTLAVQNEGHIEAALVPLIFEPFRGRAAGSQARGKGLGLGLFITREIIHAHGGRVELREAPNSVSFIANLPRDPEERRE